MERKDNESIYALDDMVKKVEIPEQLLQIMTLQWRDGVLEKVGFGNMASRCQIHQTVLAVPKQGGT